jgi:hypothetical protein
MSLSNKRPFVAPIRAVNLIWVVVVAGTVWAGYRYGTPHLRIEYVWSGMRSAPVYHACRYWGLHPFRIVPPSGECPAIVLARGEGR